MSSFTKACAELHAAAGDLPQIRESALAVTRSLDRAARSELTSEAATLIELVAHPDARVAGVVAITLGAFVEHGLPPERVGAQILRRTHDALTTALPFREALLRADRAQEDTELDDDEMLYGGDYSLPRAVAGALADTMPTAAEAYYALHDLCLPSIACMTRSPGLRAVARADDSFAEAARPFHGDAGKWLYQLLVADQNVEWVVLHAMERKGFVVRVTEVSDNWVIQPLLAAALLDTREGGLFGLGATQLGLEGGLVGKRPPPELIACLRGEGPQSARVHAAGLWEAYTWRAVQHDGLPKEDLLANKIWNEGIPADIPKLDDKRVIILGPARVGRSWSSARSFDALGSRIDHSRTLDRPEVDRWLARCASAASAS